MKLFISILVITTVSLFSIGYTAFIPKQSYTKASVLSTVRLENNKAIPDIVRIPIGGYVQFASKDGKSHNISQGHGDGYGDEHEHDEDEGALESGKFGADEAYKVQFKKVGIYDFHDHLNPTINATIIVFDPKAKK